MIPAANRLSPRQRACLELVWRRRATSKEIAAEFGISKWTVDGYIADAVELLGARDRRDAASLVFGDPPRTGSGGDQMRVSVPAPAVPLTSASMFGTEMSRPWRTATRRHNELTLLQTIAWIAAIAVGSLVALALATSVGNGLPSIAVPLIRAVQRLTH